MANSIRFENVLLGAPNPFEDARALVRSLSLESEVSTRLVSVREGTIQHSKIAGCGL